MEPVSTVVKQLKIIDELRAENQQLKDNITVLESDKDQLNSKVASLESEKQQLVDRITDLESTIQSEEEHE